MSASTLSSSARVADIIDLDRYMRASVRRSHRHHAGENLVVDAGGPERVPVGGSSTDSDRHVLGPTGHQRRVTGQTGRDKRYSHDSGLSDGTYAKRRHRPHRRITDGHGKLHDSSRKADSDSSVREFKAVCEKALQEQQQQISQIAELCQKLIAPKVLQNSENRPPQGPDTTQNIPNANNCSNKTSNINSCQNTVPVTSRPTEQTIDQSPNFINEENQKTFSSPNSTQQKVKTQNFGQNVTQNVGHRRRPLSYSSDVTSCSSGDGRRKDKHRVSVIPLDVFNISQTESCKTYNLIMGKLDELGRLFAARRALPPSSGSVSVRDKRVATERDGGLAATVVQVAHTAGRDRLAITRAHEVDISPLAGRRGGTDGESSIGQWSGSSGAAPDHGQGFDLDDPLHLYAQAKRLQALHATTKRTCELEEKVSDHLQRSLCAHCRGWLRAVRRCLKHQLFGGS